MESFSFTKLTTILIILNWFSTTLMVLDEWRASLSQNFHKTHYDPQFTELVFYNPNNCKHQNLGKIPNSFELQGEPNFIQQKEVTCWICYHSTINNMKRKKNCID
ncbi:hypothetical protein LguiA_017362 [Lonicera macranthoides]